MTLSYNLASPNNLLDYPSIFHYFQPICPEKDIKAILNGDIMTVKELADYLKIAQERGRSLD